MPCPRTPKSGQRVFFSSFWFLFQGIGSLVRRQLLDDVSGLCGFDGGPDFLFVQGTLVHPSVFCNRFAWEHGKLVSLSPSDTAGAGLSCSPAAHCSISASTRAPTSGWFADGTLHSNCGFGRSCSPFAGHELAELFRMILHYTTPNALCR